MAAAIAALVLRNQEVALITGAGKEARAESKLAQKALEAAANAKEKAESLRDGQKERIWLKRHKLLDAWAAHARALGKQGEKTAWFSAWRAAWAKPYLSPTGYKSWLEVAP